MCPQLMGEVFSRLLSLCLPAGTEECVNVEQTLFTRLLLCLLARLALT